MLIVGRRGNRCRRHARRLHRHIVRRRHDVRQHRPLHASPRQRRRQEVRHVILQCEPWHQRRGRMLAAMRSGSHATDRLRRAHPLSQHGGGRRCQRLIHMGPEGDVQSRCYNHYIWLYKFAGGQGAAAVRRRPTSRASTPASMPRMLTRPAGRRTRSSSLPPAPTIHIGHRRAFSTTAAAPARSTTSSGTRTAPMASAPAWASSSRLATATSRQRARPERPAHSSLHGNHGDLDGSPADAFTYTSGSPLSVAGTSTNPNNAEISDFVVLQVTVGTTAGAGATADRDDDLAVRLDDPVIPICSRYFWRARYANGDSSPATPRPMNR